MYLSGSGFAMRTTIACLLVILVSSNAIYAQDTSAPRRSRTIPLSHTNHFSPDSLRSLVDSSLSSVKKLSGVIKNPFKNKSLSFSDSTSVSKRLLTRAKNKYLSDSAYKDLLRNPFKSLIVKRPMLKFIDGYASYGFNYRSNIDTPYQEKNISQHSILGRVNIQVAGIVPISVTYWGRQSNSSLFRDINDVQISYDAACLANNLQAKLRERLNALTPHLRDTLSQMLLALKQTRKLELEKWLNSPAQLQKVIEANGVIRTPKITYLPDLPDSVNAKREDSLKVIAKAIMDFYNNALSSYEKISVEVDSLQKVYNSSFAKVNKMEQLVKNGWNNTESLNGFVSKLAALGMSEIEIPAKLKWLLGVRKFSLGRTTINQSELTTRNVSINGINFEYNSWYYLGVTAGVIDYRFRDFVVSPIKKSPQYLLKLSVGIGRVDGNHFIISGFKGQKQLFTGSSNRRGLSSINVLGYSLEARLKLNKTSYITGEMAESVSPDFRNNPSTENTKFGFSDKSNNAYAAHLFSYLPKSGTRVEAMYKYSGANFQSFNSFQSNAGQKAWYVKADQSFFKRQVKLTASVRSADFFNPFIIQDYKNTTIFKSISAVFRKKNWPMLTLGYMPMSQLTKLDNQLIESRFQTLNASCFHFYKIYKTSASFSIVYNKFYNNNSDSSFLYYNAQNIYASQSLYFQAFSAGLSASVTSNNNYTLTVIEENIQWNLPRWGTLGLGTKINRYSEEEIKLGAFINTSLKIGHTDLLSVGVERNYLPGLKGGLVKNEMINVQFIKSFRFK